MGRVWVAEHLTLETDVVVKFMAKDIAASADGAARFAREASVAAAVKSPHVVQVFDHGVTSDGEAYIAMELLEGRDLAAHLAAEGKLLPRDVAGLVAQVAKALGKAHQVGVIHRDIKPDNIFLCDGEGGELFVKLLDFGIAKREQVVTAATTTGAVVGTPFYMSPEQIVGEKDIDTRTDIWSLGVVAFEAMTGKRPFEGATIGAVTLAIHTSNPRITEHLPDAPAALDQWFATICARDPKARFQTAREAARALLLAVDDLPASTPLMRAPLPSMVGDASDPSLASFSVGEPSSDGRAATHLSSAFPVPRPSRKRPALVAAGIAAALVAVGAMFALPSLMGAGAASGAKDSPPPAEPKASPLPDNAAASASASAPPAVPAASAISPEPAAVIPSASASGARLNGVASPLSPHAGAPKPSARPAPAPARPTKPARTRDDDDIK